MEFIVIENWQATYADPIRLESGDPVYLTGRQDNWNGHIWLWARSVSGLEGWIRIFAPRTWIRKKIITIMEPSKTESLSGCRLGVAFGASSIVSRMEKLQAIVSLRAGGNSQSVLETWFAEPVGWLAERIDLHKAIRDELYALFGKIEGVRTRLPQAGSYLFPQLPKLTVSGGDFVRILRHQASVLVTPGTEFGPQFDSGHAGTGRRRHDHDRRHTRNAFCRKRFRSGYHHGRWAYS